MRDPQQTRLLILQTAALIIHKQGFKATSLSDILAAANISKGALYHHFANKTELGYAVLEEVFMPMFSQPWLAACESEDPIAVLTLMAQNVHTQLSDEGIEQGCPITNMCSEMATVDEGFRQRSAKIYDGLIDAIAKALPKSGLKPEVDPKHVAMYLVASLQGIMTMVKTTRCRDTFYQLNMQVVHYLNSLRTQESKQKAANFAIAESEIPDLASLYEDCH